LNEFLNNLPIQAVGLIMNTIITAILGYFFSVIRKMNIENTNNKRQSGDEGKAIKNAIRALLKDSIERKSTYLLKQGSVSKADIEILNDMNTQYKTLGGNGVVRLLIKRVEALPIYERDFYSSNNNNGNKQEG